MPMFYTPKPRQFKYRPRFYDPEKERWEALKQKYADERKLKELLTSPTDEHSTTTDTNITGATDADLQYFQHRISALDNEHKRKTHHLTWRDLFRKREMPTFNYQPRFSGNEADSTSNTHANEYKKRTVKIKRRFDITDDDYMKPVPAGRIMLYALLVCLLIYWIIF